MVHDRPMVRLIALVSLVVTLPVVAGPVGLTCAETLLLLDLTVKHLAKVDAEKRRIQGVLSIRLGDRSYRPIKFFDSTSTTRLVAKIEGREGGMEVIREFQSVISALGFAAQMSQLRDNGVAGVEVLETDRARRAVRLKHYQMCSLDWFNSSELPADLMAKLTSMRRDFADNVDGVNARYQILDGPISPTSIWLDLDRDTFRLHDVR